MSRLSSQLIALTTALMLSTAASAQLFGGGGGDSDDAKPKSNPVQTEFRELMELSKKEKRGITFYLVGAHAIPGIVTEFIGETGVEVRNREHGRIVIDLNRVQAIASP